MNIKHRFKKFGGEFIPDIVEYIREYVENDPQVTISIGCDSAQSRRRTQYAIVLMFCNQIKRNGSHLVFFRDNLPKVRDNFERLQKEAEYCQQIAEFLETEISPFYNRQDLTEYERRKYKFHIAKCNGEYPHSTNFTEDNILSTMHMTELDKNQDFKLIDLHIDFNPSETTPNSRGLSKNKSNLSYKAFIPWLRGMNFRVWVKPKSYAASCAADLLLQ